jgi:hypothetical protein
MPLAAPGMIATRPAMDLLSLLSFATIRDYSRRAGNRQQADAFADE